MKALLYFPTLALLALCAPTLPAAGAEGSRAALRASLYEVRDMKLDETAASEAEAKTNALAQAKKNALRVVLRRLTLESDWRSLPNPDNAEVESLLYGFSLSDEKISRGAGRYLARADVSFNRDAVRDLLRRNGVSYANVPSTPLLVLPVLREEGGRLLLWEKENAWMAAWGDVSSSAQLVALRRPDGNADNAAGFPLDSLTTDDDAARRQLAEKYDAGGVLLAVADLPARGAGVIKVTTLVEAPGWEAIPIEQRFTGKNGESRQSLLEQAAQGTYKMLLDSWKNAMRLSPHAPMTATPAAAPITDLAQWIRIRDNLLQSPAVEDVELRLLSVDRAEIIIRHRGDARRLATALGESGVLMEPSGPDGGWLLRETNIGKSNGGG